jgi:hypothetical protein
LRIALFQKEHKVVDVSPIPLFQMRARETVIRDTWTGNTGRGLDWNSYEASDRKAWEDLGRK